METEHERGLLAAFDEDRRAAWVPDVLGGRADTAWVNCSAGRSRPRQTETMLVPKPDGSTLSVPLLSLEQLLGLHAAVDPLKDLVDGALEPGVCGYRRGAEDGMTYRTEHRRFSEFVQAEAIGSAFIATADVRRFFFTTSWDMVLAAAAKVPGPPVEPLTQVSQVFKESGLNHLPAGYADARFLANVVLMDADRAIGLPFARWVDDYRIFAATRDEALASIDRLGLALADVGLSLHEAKVDVRPADEFARSRGATLTSVYHPDMESTGHVRAELRTVFFAATEDPIGRRREIRFALPRLAAEKDPVAITWAIAALPSIPWETPRLVDYLTTFAELDEVREGVESRLLDVLEADQTWLASRLSAAACHSGVTSHAAGKVADHLARTSSAALWALLLRVLSLSGHSSYVTEEIKRRRLDDGAAAAALMDLGIEAPDSLQDVTTALSSALHGQVVPPPSVHSIL